MVQAQKDTDKQANQQRIADKKAKAIANKAQKEVSKAERALQAANCWQHVLEEKARKAEEKAQKQTAKQAEKAAKKAAKLAFTSFPKPKLPVKDKGTGYGREKWWW